MNKILLAVAGLLFSVFAYAASPVEFTPGTFSGENGTTLPYRVLLPEGYGHAAKYPLVLFMHGAGERGDDNLKQLSHGSLIFTNPVNREKYPAVVLFPQCPPEVYWAFPARPDNGFDPLTLPVDYDITPIQETVMELVQSYVQTGNIDTDRIYIIGLSMGGMATYDLVSRFPEVFAAAVPICGAVNPRRRASAKDVSFRIFHGDSDDVVPCINSRLAYTTLKASGAEVEYYELPGMNHGSWNPAFNFPDFFDWLFLRKKHK